MRKRITIIALSLIMIFTWTPLAEAKENGKYVMQAEQLNILGVFKGTSNGFELDRQATRLEGLIMLIRLLGKEEEAQALKDQPCVFTDIPDWGKGYANYAYSNGLSIGTGNNLFGTTDKIKAQAYITFMLRALEYDDSKGEFTYNTSLDFANEKGLLQIDDLLKLTDEVFLRDHMAMVSMLALNTQIKASKITLLQKLIGEGVISLDQVKQLNAKDEKTDVLTAVQIGKFSKAILFISATGYDESEWTGSGFYVSKDGNIITNYHVVEGAKTLEIIESDGTIYQGAVKVTGYDKEKDIALLAINKKPDLYLEIGDSDSVELGEDVYAFGSPLGLQNTLSSGIVSSFRDGFIQISAPISQGSSGGALLNNRGKVIGITSAIYEAGANLGLAIPIKEVSLLTKNLDLDLASFYAITRKAEKPMGLILNQITNDMITVQWDQVESVDYYRVYLRNSINREYEKLSDNTGNDQWDWFDGYSLEITDLIPEQKYYVRVTWVKDGKESQISQIQSIQLENQGVHK